MPNRASNIVHVILRRSRRISDYAKSEILRFTQNDKRHLFATLALFLLTIIFLAIPAQAEIVERIVAIVNGDIITETDIEDRIKQGEQIQSKTRAFKELEKENRRRMALESLINQTILDQQIEKADIEVTDHEVENAIKNILAQNHMSMQELRMEIAKKGLTWSKYEENVRREIKKIKFVNQVISTEIKISDRDLRDYFDKNRGSFHGGKQVHIAEIVFPFIGIDSEAEAIALRDKAISVAREAQANPEAFARLAKQNSQGPNADQGGDLGMVNIADLPSMVGEMVRNLPAGGVTPPIPTDNAIVIAKVVAWPKLSAEEFEKVRDTIYDRLHDERIADALKAYVQRAKQDAYIEIR
jgi:peptidyl-prolyl cis-trans isomerase SurA